MLKPVIMLMMFSSVALNQTVRYMPTENDLKYTFGGHPPVMTIRPGTILETWTEDCYAGSV